MKTRPRCSSTFAPPWKMTSKVFKVAPGPRLPYLSRVTVR